MRFTVFTPTGYQHTTHLGVMAIPYPCGEHQVGGALSAPEQEK